MTLTEIKKNRPDLRQIAKSVSFALAYGGNGYTISNNLGISTEEGEEIYNSYFKAFPGLKQYFNNSINESMSKGYILIDSISNRKYFFKDFKLLKDYKKNKQWREFYGLKGKYERACLNYKIQGAAGSITKLACILFRKYIIENNLEDKVFITNAVHDEIVIESTSFHEVHAKALEKAMYDAGKRWCNIVPLYAEAVITDYWHH